ncbi:MAG: hypothetical protein A2275_03395 [Bacteroidetes bacterium RIFOXYA12_FULL_35_11]|nr:MAG: hypothetical protein A2X01_17165 [Bacteroidetes bacterium GWF2_35_48]OFY82030.1 MAG: hypothetical protein A2275_03395 [Bacteroidetes bacterium RIFOXYA12_FULL_35_11]HBX51832.1 hypothetical protein [Bacteroidales bacterium]
MSITSINLQTDAESNTACLTFLCTEEITLLIQLCDAGGQPFNSKTTKALTGLNSVALSIQSDRVKNNFALKIIADDAIYHKTFKTVSKN